MSCFDTALKFTLKWEGGFVDNPLDPGGATNEGITQTVYNAYRSREGLSKQSVRDITNAEVSTIYQTEYWNPSLAGEMLLPLAVAQFDTAVNFGVGGAIEFLQEALGVNIDGIAGTQTQLALKEKNKKSTALAIANERVQYRYKRVAEDPSQKVFLQGWLARDNALKKYVETLG